MSFSDTFKKNPEKHVDTPAQAEARTAAAADVKSKTDAKTARDATLRTAKESADAAKEAGAKAK